jgi:hypothetical protein
MKIAAKVIYGHAQREALGKIAGLGLETDLADRPA